MFLRRLILALIAMYPIYGRAQTSSLDYHVETTALVSNGRFAPLWFTSNSYGRMGNDSKQLFIHSGLTYERQIKHYGAIELGFDLAGGLNTVSDFWLQQAYVDVSWKKMNLSIGSKERTGFPLDKNEQLTSGWLVEGPNARPVPQVRIAVKDYWTVPGTQQWLSLKGHLAYGQFVDGRWQKHFAGSNRKFTQHTLYHTKSLMFRIGQRECFPIEFEFGLLMATQFGGSQYLKHSDGTVSKTMDMPSDLKAYWKAFFPKKGGDNTVAEEQVNVEGNMLGSWNFSLKGYCGDWTIKAYLEHYFEDHSQMFWEYGRWKDGQLGIEITPPLTPWITSIVWEGMSTKYCSGPVLYDGFWGSFPDLQMSGGDTYYNHYIYQSWQHYGQGMGNPLLVSPIYNSDGSLEFKSTRMRSNHLGLSGNPSSAWHWRFLASFARHWGTYLAPLDKQRKQFSGLIEVNHLFAPSKGWSASLSVGLDRGNYIGNSFGGMITLRKIGGFKQ